MKRLSPVVVVGIVISALLAGCSLKEDRSECPCVLVLDFRGVDIGRSDSSSLSVLSAGDFLYKDVIRSDAYGELYSVDVPMGNAWVNVYSPESGSRDFSYMLSDDAASLTIPSGEDCPQVNMFSFSREIIGETILVEVTLRKNWCGLTISMVSAAQVDFNLTLVGGICGYDRDGQPAEGDFQFTPAMESGGIWWAGIPRQVDSSLRLLISDEEEVLREFAIGEYILESGYDWTAADLEDVYMEINYAKTGITFSINGWVKTIEMDVVI